MQLNVAACGWLGPAWSNCYPEDMPESWRLDYYANEHDAIVVPAADWQSRTESEIEQWLEAVPPGFLFYWQLEQESNPEPLLATYQRRPDLTLPGGWLLSGSGGVESLRQQLSTYAPAVSCDSRWHCHDTALAVLPLVGTVDLAQMRAQLEQMVGKGQERVVLLVMPSGSAGTSLHQLQTFSQLYGG